jgi:hypothetical protein
MKTIAAFTLLMLTIGCSTLPKASETVYVPVYISCVGNVPKQPDKTIPRSDSVSEQVRALLIDMERSKAYQAELMAVISGCL